MKLILDTNVACSRRPSPSRKQEQRLVVWAGTQLWQISFGRLLHWSHCPSGEGDTHVDEST